jgi:hypothetical protein
LHANTSPGPHATDEAADRVPEAVLAMVRTLKLVMQATALAF